MDDFEPPEHIEKRRLELFFDVSFNVRIDECLRC